MGDIRVLTWNLWWRRGPWQQRYAAITDVLHTTRPDVCGLQEVWADPRTNIVESLAARLGMHWRWTPSPKPERWNVRISDPSVVVGNAVLSRWPIMMDEHIRLPAGNSQDEGRTATFALIQGPNQRIPFFTTHLNSAADQSAIRCLQARALVRFVAERLDEDFPPVVTGDFNAEPDSDEIRLLGGLRTASPVPGFFLLDAWQYADPEVQGPTWSRKNDFAALHWAPSARIDYIFVGPPKNSGAGRIKSAHLVGDSPVGGIWPSDHAGVLAVLAAS